jgi:hypothetical protein
VWFFRTFYRKKIFLALFGIEEFLDCESLTECLFEIFEKERFKGSTWVLKFARFGRQVFQFIKYAKGCSIVGVINTAVYQKVLKPRGAKKNQ